MKLYNSELHEIENLERENRIKILAKRNIEFLVENYGIDKEFLKKKFELISVVEREGKTHFVEYNGKKEEINTTDAASFVAKKSQVYDGDKWIFENAIYTNDTNSDHTITHELFHYFSSNLEMRFNSGNIGYDKIGLHITGYNRDDQVVDKSMKAIGLNEGITEFLTTQLDGGIQSISGYDYPTYIAGILANSQDKSLIKAYFSSDTKEFQEFLKDFDNRQSIVSSKKLISLSKIGNEMVDISLLKGCLEYTLSFCNNMEELKNVRKRLLPIFKSMRNNINIEFEDKNFDVKNFFTSALSQKMDSIQSKSTEELRKETMNVQQEISFINEIQQNIEKEEAAIKNKETNTPEL